MVPNSTSIKHTENSVLRIISRRPPVRRNRPRNDEHQSGEETDKLETVALSLVIITLDFLESNGRGTETMHSEFLDVGLEPVLNLLGHVAGANVDNDAGHTIGYALASEFPDGFLMAGTLSTLVNGVEWLEVQDIETGVGLGRVRDGTDDTNSTVSWFSIGEVWAANLTTSSTEKGP